MRRLIPTVALLGLLAACTGSGGASNLDGTAWDFFAYDLGSGAVDVLPGTEPTIAFEAATLSGSDGCNNFTGPYTIDAGNMLDIGPLASTQRACEPDVDEQARVILMILDEAILFEKEEGRLFIRNADGEFLGYDEFQPPD